MTRDELIERLNKLAAQSKTVAADIEVIHCNADEALLSYIDYAEITEIYDTITKWYA